MVNITRMCTTVPVGSYWKEWNYVLNIIIIISSHDFRVTISIYGYINKKDNLCRYYQKIGKSNRYLVLTSFIMGGDLKREEPENC